MIKNITTVIILVIFHVCIMDAQEIQLIKDLAPGAFDGYLDDGQLHQEELYFVSNVSYFELYKINKGHKIEKVYGFPNHYSVLEATYAGNSIYFFGEGVSAEIAIKREKPIRSPKY